MKTSMNCTDKSDNCIFLQKKEEWYRDGTWLIEVRSPQLGETLSGPASYMLRTN